MEGPTVFGGCIELCSSSKFSISALTPATIDTKLRLGDVAMIIKRKHQASREMEGALRELVTDADVYTLDFHPSVHLAPQQKASMLAALVLTDVMFFERDDAACRLCSAHGCNLCNIYCGGCLCSCW